MKGYQSFLNNLFNDRRIDSISRDILLFLNCFPNEAFPSISMIQKVTHKDPKTINLRMNILEKAGYLKKITRGSKHRTNYYALNYEIIRPSISIKNDNQQLITHDLKEELDVRQNTAINESVE